MPCFIALYGAQAALLQLPCQRLFATLTAQRLKARVKSMAKTSLGITQAKPAVTVQVQATVKVKVTAMSIARHSEEQALAAAALAVVELSISVLLTIMMGKGCRFLVKAVQVQVQVVLQAAIREVSSPRTGLAFGALKLEAL